MALEGRAFEEISEADLIELVTNAVPEGLLVEYKQSVYGGSDAEKKEFLKDISAFANSSGGHLVIGLPEVNGVPSRPLPFSGDPDAEVRRMESLARDGIQPRIIGLRIGAVQLAAGGCCFVIRVPKSWIAPHRVIYQNSNRFYARHSASSPELSLDELRAAFTASASSFERAKAFRGERLARIDAGDAIEPLSPGKGIAVLHIIPLWSFGPSAFIDVDRAKSYSAGFVPIGQNGSKPRLNFDGYISRADYGDGLGYTQVFRNGIVEATYTDMLYEENGGRWLPMKWLEKALSGAVASYAATLDKLSVPAPLAVAISILGVRGAAVGFGDRPGMFKQDHAIPQHQLDLPIVMLNEYQGETEWWRLLRPAMSALANASGASLAHLKNPDGEPIPIQ